MIWSWVAAGLTLIVLSRAFGDNPLFRMSQYFFVGLALGYTVTILVTQVFAPKVSTAINTGISPQQVSLLVPVVLGVMLLTRLGRQQATWLANFPLALLFGVSAAVALLGAIVGTIVPQIRDSFLSGLKPALDNPTPANLSILGGQIVVLVGLILVLLSFSFTRGRPAPAGGDPTVLEPGRGAVVGRWLLVVSLGVTFAGALLTYQTALIDRIQELAHQVGLI